MTRMRLITVGLAALLCMAFAASALAAGKGEIVNSKGEAPVKKAFTAKSTTAGLLETVAGSKIACTETNLKGTIESKTTGKGTFTFTGCSSTGLKCKTGAEAAGTVVVPVGLTASVVSSKDYLNNSVAEIDIKCSTVDIKVKGNLLVPATPEGALKTSFTFAAEGSKGVQKPVDTVTPHLEANFAAKGFEHASLQQTNLVTTFEETVEFI